jgi:hypothetical protein
VRAEVPPSGTTPQIFIAAKRAATREVYVPKTGIWPKSPRVRREVVPGIPGSKSASPRLEIVVASPPVGDVDNCGDRRFESWSLQSRVRTITSFTRLDRSGLLINRTPSGSWSARQTTSAAIRFGELRP